MNYNIDIFVYSDKSYQKFLKNTNIKLNSNYQIC